MIFVGGDEKVSRKMPVWQPEFSALHQTTQARGQVLGSLLRMDDNDGGWGDNASEAAEMAANKAKSQAAVQAVSLPLVFVLIRPKCQSLPPYPLISTMRDLNFTPTCPHTPRRAWGAPQPRGRAERGAWAKGSSVECFLRHQTGSRA